VHLVGFIIRNLSRCTVTRTSYHDARSHERLITMHCHMDVKKFFKDFQPIAVTAVTYNE